MNISIRSRGYLPHWEAQGAVYFVTFRLADSLPREILEQFRAERELIERAARSGTTVSADHQRSDKLRALLQKAERLLDNGLGECHMRDPRIAQIAADALRQFDGQRYRLLAWCVMPNHVHVLFAPLSPHRLESILQSWKSYSAHEANRVLRRTASFWQREYFDHLVRGQSHLLKFTKYIQDNPHKAGLQNWPWVSTPYTAPRTAAVPAASPRTAGVSPASSSPLRRPEASGTKTAF